MVHELFQLPGYKMCIGMLYLITGVITSGNVLVHKLMSNDGCFYYVRFCFRRGELG